MIDLQVGKLVLQRQGFTPSTGNQYVSESRLLHIAWHQGQD